MTDYEKAVLLADKLSKLGTGGLKMSKFNYDVFTGNYPVVVSKERYTEQQAIEVARRELGADDVEKFDGYVRYGYGIDDDDIAAGVRNTWWLTLSSICPKRCCPVWAFRVRRTENETN